MCLHALPFLTNSNFLIANSRYLPEQIFKGTKPRAVYQIGPEPTISCQNHIWHVRRTALVAISLMTPPRHASILFVELIRTTDLPLRLNLLKNLLVLRHNINLKPKAKTHN